MPTKPKIKTLTNSSIDVLNAIRNSATVNYQNYVPIATADPENIREIGAIIMDMPQLQNEFLSALVNRIGRVILTSKMYSNPWEMFKKGMLEYGETIEEIFVNIAKPFQYDPQVAESDVYKREIPDVRSAFHVMNYQKFYKATIQQEQLRQAFLSADGISQLIAGIVDQMYTAANYDEFLTMKYLLAKKILAGQFHPVTVDALTAANSNAVTTTIKETSNMLVFPSTEYNPAGVFQHTEYNDQYLIMSAKAKAVIDVNTLAAAFNMDKADFMGHVVTIDSFGSLDVARLNVLFADDPTYTEIGTAELEALAAIPAVSVGRDWFMVYDNLMQFTENYNGQGLYWNYFYHVWKIFSSSPFENAVVYVPETPGVTSVTVSPKAAQVKVGGTLQLTAIVKTTGFASQAVNWSVATATFADTVTVDRAGLVHIDKDAPTDKGMCTIKCTSVFDSTKFDECDISIKAS
uniref:Head protein n=1 Tax=Podoviridae sp. cthau23 TaxID=2825268 RepID=A0A8S5U721_9CAUD|nr:MAG TPA: Head protein [Podoviridae sp. cthau23]